jgi:gamma-tubulin complex component 2
LERAAVPYFGMLDAWIRYGEIRDPYDEFMVQERRDLRRGDSTRPDLLDEYPLLASK